MPPFALLSIRQAEIAQGKFGLVSAKCDMGFDALVAQYLDLVSFHKRGYGNECYVARTLKEYMGKRRISEITGEDGERFKSARSRVVRLRQ